MQRRIALLLPVVLVFAVSARAQGQTVPEWSPTPHYETAPSLPVKGPIVRRHPGEPGGTARNGRSSLPPKVGIEIGGYDFMMDAGPCAHSVDAAIMAHADLFTGDKACDAQIRKARAIQRQREAENPAYANEPRITPAPTPAAGSQSDP